MSKLKSMTKENKIKQFLAEPIKVGERAYVRGLGSQNKDAFSNSAEVIDVKDNGVIVITKYGTDRVEVNPEDYKKSTNHIGENPFPSKPWNSRLKLISYSLYSILHSCGFEREVREYETSSGMKNIPLINWNPIFIDEGGNEVVFQRDFCWSLKDKQLLIDSIYNNIDIGKIVLRLRSYEYVIERAGQNKEVGWKDVVDGKQRLNAILGFVNGEFEDTNGNKFEDLSDNAQHQFLDFMSIAYGEIGEDATDEDVKSVFMGVNFAGVPMSKEHIDFVKSINLK